MIVMTTPNGKPYPFMDDTRMVASLTSDIQELSNNMRENAEMSAYSGKRALGPDYRFPGPFDVICARGKFALNHPGNQRLRAMIETKVEEYATATSKTTKSAIVSSVLDDIREASPMGGFVKCEDGQWFEVGDHVAREKIGQCFRDSLHTKYKSSTKAKVIRKRTGERSGNSSSRSSPMTSSDTTTTDPSAWHTSQNDSDNDDNDNEKKPRSNDTTSSFQADKKARVNTTMLPDPAQFSTLDASHAAAATVELDDFGYFHPIRRDSLILPPQNVPSSSSLAHNYPSYGSNSMDSGAVLYHHNNHPMMHQHPHHYGNNMPNTNATVMMPTVVSSNANAMMYHHNSDTTPNYLPSGMEMNIGQQQHTLASFAQQNIRHAYRHNNQGTIPFMSSQGMNIPPAPYHPIQNNLHHHRNSGTLYNSEDGTTQDNNNDDEETKITHFEPV